MNVSQRNRGGCRIGYRIVRDRRMYMSEIGNEMRESMSWLKGKVEACNVGTER